MIKKIALLRIFLFMALLVCQNLNALVKAGEKFKKDQGRKIPAAGKQTGAAGPQSMPKILPAAQKKEESKIDKVLDAPGKAEEFVKEAAEKVGEKVQKKVDESVTKIKEKITGPKTEEQKAASAKKKADVKSLMEQQRVTKGQDAEKIDGPMDKIFAKVASKLAAKTPGATKLMQKSLALHSKIDNSAIGKLSKKMSERTAAAKTKAQGGIFDKAMVKNDDVDAALKLPENVERFEKELGQKVQDTLEKDARKSIEKDLTVEKEKAGIKIDDVVKAEIKKQVEVELAKKTFSQGDKKRVESQIKGDFEKSFKKNVKSELVDKILTDQAEKKIMKMAVEDPKDYRKELEKIAKTMGLKPSEVKDLIENPTKEGNLQKAEILRAQVMDDIKADVKRSTLGKISNFSQDLRQKVNSPKVLGAAIGGSVIYGLLIGQIQNMVAKSGLASRLSEQVDRENLEDTLAQDAQGKLTIQVSQPDSASSLTIEQALLNGTKSVFNFYTHFDVFFKNVLQKFEYDDKFFNAADNVTFPGGAAEAGTVILFGYSGAGNIATGFTPLPIKTYPLHILGQSVAIESIITSISSDDVIDLIGGLIASAPEIIFCIKVISLLNTANKKFTDPQERVAFLNNEMDLLYARFVKTVNDRQTARSNALQPDDSKWDLVYLKYPVDCLQAAPKIIRDMIKNMVVEGVKDENGKPETISFEQYLVDRFEEFKEMNEMVFEGDLKYVEHNEPLDDVSAEKKLFSIFLRAFNDISEIEASLMKKSEKIEIAGINGQKQEFEGKRYFMQLTQKTFNNLQKTQEEFIGVMIDSADDLLNKVLQKKYAMAEQKYNQALSAYEKSILKYRHLICFYAYERTLGIEPERVFDFITRECQRTYRLASDKIKFEASLEKIFNLYAENFSFTFNDLLKYVKSTKFIDPPIRIRELITKTPKDITSEVA